MSGRKRVTSRLAKKEQKQMTQQTLLLTGLSLVILVLFILVIMPGAIRLFFNILDKGNVFEPADTIPPQMPVITAPVTATYSAQLKLTGYGEPDSQVIFLVNRKEQGKTTVNNQGEFKYNLKLKSGDNLVKTYSVDLAGNESAEQTYQILMDQERPEIEIKSPANEAHFELEKDRVVEITGQTEPRAKVYVNGRLSLADEDGHFQARYRLNEGENKLEIKARDVAGNEAQTELVLFYDD